MEITFLNGDEKFKERGLRALEATARDIRAFMEAAEEDGEPYTEDLGHLDEYSLSLEYHEPDGYKSGYFGLLLSWGGPSDEIRFYEGGAIEYVFLDWFVGVGFDVTNEDWAQWIKSHYEDFFEDIKEKALEE